MTNTTSINAASLSSADQAQVVEHVSKYFNTDIEAGEKRYMNNKVFAAIGAVAGAGIHMAITGDVKASVIGAVVGGTVTGLLAHVQDQFVSTGSMRVAEAGIYGLCGMRMAYDVSTTANGLLTAVLGHEETTEA